jgi:hypothetical protein
MEHSEGSHLPKVVLAIVIAFVLIGLPVAVMTIPALRWLNPHAHH